MSHTDARPANEALGLSNICKKYHDNSILYDINLSIGKGELCAILGENGAGKTELMNIIAGISCADTGAVWVEGQHRTIGNPQDAFELGIALVPQEPEVMEMLTVEQSIYLNRELTYRWLPFVNRREQCELIGDILQFMEWDVSPFTRVGSLSQAERKLLLLARALRFDCKLLILDDLTANFEYHEAQHALRLIRRIHERGVTILFVSHKMEEILALADHAVVLNEGNLVADIRPVDEAAVSLLTERIAGPDQRRRYPRTRGRQGDILLRTHHLGSTRHNLRDLNLYARAGEIVGVVDLEAITRTALINLLSGVERPNAGALVVEGRKHRFHGLRDAVKAGVVVMGAENAHNLYASMDVYFNVSASNLQCIGFKHAIWPRAIHRFTDEYLQRINLRRINPWRPVGTLSYGTQQKLALSRILCSDRKVLIMVDPTAGVDNVSKLDMYNIMNQLTHGGRCILLFSNDLQELSGMCDRVYVICGDSISAEFSHCDVTPLSLLRNASGNA